MKRLQNLKEMALFLLDAINNEDYKNAKKCLHSAFVYKDPFIKTTGAETFLEVMKKRNLKYQLLKVFATDQDVCLVYNLLDGMDQVVTASGIYHFKDDKIESLEMVYDPRPLIDSVMK